MEKITIADVWAVPQDLVDLEVRRVIQEMRDKSTEPFPRRVDPEVNELIGIHIDVRIDLCQRVFEGLGYSYGQDN